YVGPGLGRWRPHDWQQTEQNGTNRHDLRANALHSALHHSQTEVAHRVHATKRLEFVPGMVQVKQHDDTRFRVEPSQRDEADPDGDTHVVAEEVEEPER